MPKHEILVPNIANFGCFGPKPDLKTPIARTFLDQNEPWVEKIKGEFKKIEMLGGHDEQNNEKYLKK